MSAKDVIIALDFPTREETLSFLDQFPAGEKPFVKIGMELFYAEGPQVVRDIKARGHKIFLDLKLHDIPNTVKRAMAVLSRLDVDMVNLHAAGTSEMMKAALEGVTAVYQLFDAVTVTRKNPDDPAPARSYQDYTVAVDEAALPAGVICQRMG